MSTSEVLYAAANAIEGRGWTKGPGGMFEGGGLCAMGAIDLASHGGLTGDYGTIYRCPAGRAVYDYLEGREGLVDGQDRIWQWNDDRDDASEVIEVLRACAVIEAAREEQDAAWETYAELVTA